VSHKNLLIFLNSKDGNVGNDKNAGYLRIPKSLVLMFIIAACFWKTLSNLGYSEI